MTVRARFICSIGVGSSRLLLLSLCVGAFALVIPSEAWAHGIAAGAETIPEFVWLGIRHMVGGWDHLLFIAGIVVLAGAALRAAKLISFFVLGHSTTLLVATLAGWRLNADAVDVAIAISVAYIGWRILRGRPEEWNWTVLTIFGFGLVHGLGLSTRLQDLVLPSGGALVARILAFNLGVEVGQLLALSVIVGLGLLALKYRPRLEGGRPYAAGSLVAVGVVAAAIFSVLALRPGGSNSAEAAAARCVERPFAPDIRRASRGGHAEQSFYAPGEQAPVADLQHSTNDGYIVVTYHPRLTREQQGELRRWVEEGRGTIAVAGKPVEGPALQATTLRTIMTCQEYSLSALDEFRDSWFNGG